VVNLRRVLSFDGVPTILDDIWLPGAVFRGLTADSFSRYKGPLYAFFESEYGVSMVRAEEKIRAMARSEEHTSELQSREKLVCRLLPEKKNVAPLPDAEPRSGAAGKA